jgi:hypothetical protein
MTLLYPAASPLVATTRLLVKEEWKAHSAGGLPRWVSRQNTASFFFFFFFFLNALAVKHETCTLTLISKANSSLLFRVVFAVLQVSGQNFIYGKFPRFNQRRINQNLIQDRPVVFVHGSLSRSVIL